MVEKVRGYGRAAVLLALLAAALAAGVYANALHSPFVYDDRTEVRENQSIRQLTNLPSVVRGNLTRPVVNLSYAVDYAIWELNPFGYHLTNLLLHILNVLLLFTLVHHLVRDGWGRHTPAKAAATLTAFTAASLFAVHPMMTEAVGYVSSRSELLSGAMFLSSLLCFRRAFVIGGRVWLAVAIMFFVAGLGAKETVAMLPIVLLAYDGLLLRRPEDGRLLRFPRVHAVLLLAMFLAAGVRVWWYVAVEQAGAAGTQWQNALVELHVMVRYISLLLYPASQSVVQPVYPIASISDSRVVTSIGVLLLFVGMAAIARRRDPLVTFGVTWFFVLLLPSALLIVLASFGQPMAEHRVYLASCGFFIAAAAVIAQFLPEVDLRRKTRLAAVAAGLIAVVTALAALTVARNRVWQSPVRLWEDAAQKAPLTWMAVYGMADAYRSIGDDVSAAAAYQRAIALRPRGTDAYVGLARSLIGLGRNEYARQVLRAAIEGAPENTDARLALALVEEEAFQDPAEAVRLCRETLAIDPKNADADACVRRNQPAR